MYCRLFAINNMILQTSDTTVPKKDFATVDKSQGKMDTHKSQHHNLFKSLAVLLVLKDP